MIQTLALFIDAYRELNSKKLFWITLVLSGMVASIFILLGIDNEGITFCGYHLPLPVDTTLVTPSFFYRQIFFEFGAKLWLTWAATILALVSTSGIFPDLLVGGSIDLYLSKPISRLRFFLTKYVTSLLFVTLQVTAFVAGTVLVLRVRGGEWLPKIFLAVPIVVLFFSYLYSICVLLGVITRSTVAAMLLTLLIWLGIFAVHFVEADSFLKQKFKTEIALARVDRLIAQEQERAKSGQQINSFWHNGSHRTMDQLLAERSEDQDKVDFATKWHRMAYSVEAVLPKTSDTIALMHRWLVSATETKRAAGDLGDPDTEDEPVQVVWSYTTDDMRADFKEREAVRNRPASWSIGTSLIFEFVVVGIAAWIFCRRDY